MDKTFPDLLRVVDEDIKEVLKEIRSLDSDNFLVIGVLVLATLFIIFVAKRRVEQALELYLDCHKLRVDLFFMYVERNGTWYAGHGPGREYFVKYHHSNFSLLGGSLGKESFGFMRSGEEHQGGVRSKLDTTGFSLELEESHPQQRSHNLLE